MAEPNLPSYLSNLSSPPFSLCVQKRVGLPGQHGAGGGHGGVCQAAEQML